MNMFRPKWQKISTSLVFFTVLGMSSWTVGAAELPGAGKSVQPVFTEDQAAVFQLEVALEGLRRLGYDVKDTKNVDIPAAHIALSQGDADIYAQNWDPLQNAFYERAGGSAKLTRVGNLVKGALQGYLIDKATADKYKIRYLEQLKDPTIAKLFDGDGDGRADLIGCPPGWGCEKAIEFQLDAYNLRDTVEHIQGDFTVTHVDAVTRQKAGQSILYYAYTPLWLGQILVPGKEVVWLEVEETKLPPEEKSAVTISPDGKNLGWAVNNIRIVANNSFLEANAGAKKFFELLTIPLADVNAENLLVYNGEKTDEQIRHHVEQWVKDNAAEFDSWIAEAIKAAQ